MSQNNYKPIFFRESMFKVAELIFNEPNKTFHIRLLEKETGLSTTAVTKAAKDLSSLQIITIEKTPITTNIRANTHSEEYRSYKIIFNLYKLRLHGITDRLMSLFHNPKAVLLFGSYAKGEDIEESDVDILVISHNKVPDLDKFLLPIEKKIRRKLNIHVIPDLRKSSKEFKNAIANGIVLYGYIKVI